MKSFKYIVPIILFVVFGGPIFAKKELQYRAAGVLPYAFDGNGTMQFLVGLSSVHGDQASDFGGLRDDEDNNDPVHTAAREGCEELMFIFDANESFEKLSVLADKHGKDFDVRKANSATYQMLYAAAKKASYSFSNNYRMYLVPIDYQENIVGRFQKRKDAYERKLRSCWNETTSLAWIAADAIFQKIDTRQDTDSIVINGVTLYEPFVQSLIVARSQGIIDAVQKSNLESQPVTSPSIV